MHGLGTLTRGTQRILATSPLRCGLSHKENPLRRPAEAAAAEAEAAAEAAAAEAFLESPELMEADAHAAGGKDAVDGGGMEPPELVFELDEPTFAPTYRTWTVEYTDGTSKVFEA